MTVAVLSITNPTGGKLSTGMMDIMQQFMDATADATNDEVKKFLGENPGSTLSCALDVVYLRTRSRWNSELEKRLIREHAEGKKVMISDWPDHSNGNYDPYTGQSL